MHGAETTFADRIDALPLDALATAEYSAHDARVALAARQLDLPGLAALIAPAGDALLGQIATRARDLTLQRFGRTVQLFAPLYLSNECVNTCLYCGFSRQNEIARRTLTGAEVDSEARVLAERGFRNLLLVSAEHPKKVPVAFIADAVRTARRHATLVQVEVQGQPRDAYDRLRGAGCDGVVIYQETYDRTAYDRLHPYGMKRDMHFRLGAPERIASAGIRHVGLGALLGLTADWRREVLALAAHALHVQRRHPGTQVNVALPRLKPAAGDFAGESAVGDRDFVRALCALRLLLPEAGIVLSTREPAALRDALVGVGVMHMSAGSATEPGGYEQPGVADPQFEIDDERPPGEVADRIAQLGYEPVWHDWSAALAQSEPADEVSVEAIA